jgi:peptidoglycan hydrolase CwlO-like protein
MCGGELELSADKISGTCSSCGSASAYSEARAAKANANFIFEAQKKHQQELLKSAMELEKEITQRKERIQRLVEKREVIRQEKGRVKVAHDRKSQKNNEQQKQIEHEKTALEEAYKKKMLEFKDAIVKAEGRQKKVKANENVIIVALTFTVTFCVVCCSISYVNDWQVSMLINSGVIILLIVIAGGLLIGEWQRPLTRANKYLSDIQLAEKSASSQYKEGIKKIEEQLKSIKTANNKNLIDSVEVNSRINEVSTEITRLEKEIAVLEDSLKNFHTTLKRKG